MLKFIKILPPSVTLIFILISTYIYVIRYIISVSEVLWLERLWEVISRLIFRGYLYLIPLDPMPFLPILQSKNQGCHYVYERKLTDFSSGRNQPEICKIMKYQAICFSRMWKWAPCPSTFMCCLSAHPFASLLLQGAIHCSVNNKNNMSAQLLMHLATALGCS